MINILWKSPYVPHDTAHAGGKTENYYMKAGVNATTSWRGRI